MNTMNIQYTVSVKIFELPCSGAATGFAAAVITLLQFNTTSL